MTRLSTRVRCGALAALAWMPVIASAHAGHGDIAGFGDGMVHVASGLDHMVAALAVGLWAMAWPIRRAWVLPVVYVLAMSAATWFGVGREAGPSLETMLVATIIVLGGLVATSRHMPAVAAALVVAVFGAIHGYAHGAEAGTSGSIPMYIVGLASATLALHVAGMGIGLMARLASRWGMRVAGAAIAAAGVWFALAT